jgi:hypothetical protein
MHSGYAHHEDSKSSTGASKASQRVLLPTTSKQTQEIPPVIESPATKTEPGSIPFTGPDQDTRCFEFFRTVTLPKVFCPFNAGFWNCLLLQLCHTEPATWHSLLAFASINERRVISGRKEAPQFTLNHYARAVELLTNRISQTKPYIEVLLSNCYLFFTLEMSLGNVEGAITQVQGGLQLIQSWRKTNGSRPNKTIDSLFNPILNMMLSCAFIYGREVVLTTRYPNDPHIPRLPPFETIYSASVVLVNLSASCWQTAREFETYKFSNKLTSYDQYLASSYKRQIRDRHREWRAKFEKITSKVKMSDLSPAGVQAVTLGKVWSIVSPICIMYRFGLEETPFDAHVQEFEEALDLTESVFGTDSDPGPPRLSSTDWMASPFLMHYFSQVYLIAIKCRHPQIRRRALADLKNFPYEGSWNSSFWNAKMMYRVAERVMEIEEEGLGGRGNGTGSRVPSESARVHDIRIPSGLVNDSLGKMVQFRLRVDRQWIYREESFVI